MNKKLLVLDIDGTLVNSKKELTDGTKKAIFEAMDAGHMVMIASGRPTPGLYKVANELELGERGGYLLSFNGSKVTKAADGEIIYQQKMPREPVAALYDYAASHDCGIMTYDEDIISGTRVDEYIELESRITGMKIKEVDNFKEYVTFDVNKCIITADPKVSEQYMNELRGMFSDVLNIGRSEPFFIEITARGIDKAYTLSQILPILGVDREDVICCGDGFNDKTMIEFAGLGVAMANAQEEVKAAADYITLSNDEDGVAHVIYKFMLDKE